jgi:hypothetical protein
MEYRLQRGKELFQYMTDHFDSMLEGDDKFKYFDELWFANYSLEEYADEYETQLPILQPLLRKWVQKEIEDGNLFQFKNWKATRDSVSEVGVMMVYKKFFIYNNIYFQFVILDYYDEEKNNIGRFVLSLFGFKTSESEYFIQNKAIKIPPDEWILDSYWNDPRYS